MNTFWVPRNPYIHVLTILYFNEVSPDLLSFPLNYFYCQSLLKRFPDMSHSCWLALDVPQFVGISCLPPVLWLLEAAGAQVGGGRRWPTQARLDSLLLVNIPFQPLNSEVGSFALLTHLEHEVD